MRLKHIIDLHRQGNVCVFGLRGTGKDLLQGNVIARDKRDYYSNMNYGYKYHPLDFNAIDIAGNNYNNFIKGDIKPYKYPYLPNCDIYISDAGVYFPSQYHGEISRDYKHLPVFMALSRQVGPDVNVHTNTQALNRVVDKIREQGSIYINTLWCKYIKIFKFHLVIQKVRIYDRYETALSKRDNPSYWCPLMADKATVTMVKNQRKSFVAEYGNIKNGLLIYRNKSKHDTHRFKTILEQGGLNET